MNEKRQLVFDALDSHNIKYEITEHPAVYTMEEMEALGMHDIEKVAKNLFVCDDKKRNFFLITLTMNKTANLKLFREKLACRPLSFASEARLTEILGLQKGEVTPLGVLNDREHIVRVVFDEDIRSFDKVGVHPNDNTATIWLAPSDLEKVLRANGTAFSYLKL